MSEPNVNDDRVLAELLATGSGSFLQAATRMSNRHNRADRRETGVCVGLSGQKGGSIEK